MRREKTAPCSRSIVEPQGQELEFFFLLLFLATSSTFFCYVMSRSVAAVFGSCWRENISVFTSYFKLESIPSGQGEMCLVR